MVIYRDCGVSFCDKLQQDCTCVYLEKKKSEWERKKRNKSDKWFL